MKYILILLSIPIALLAQTYIYDQAGHLIGVKYSDEKEIGYEYDKSGNILKVASISGSEEPVTPDPDDDPGASDDPTDEEPVTYQPEKKTDSFDMFTLLLLLFSFFPLYFRKHLNLGKNKVT